MIHPDTLIVHKSPHGKFIAMRFGPMHRLEMFDTIDRWYAAGIFDADERAFFKNVIHGETWQPFEGFPKGLGVALGLSVLAWGLLLRVLA